MPDGASEKDRLLARFGRKFKRGDVIFREGDEASEAYLLQEGAVRLVKRVRAVERSLMVLRANDLFGETALIDGAVRTSTAVALSDGASLALEPVTFRRILEANSAIAVRVVQQLVRRLGDAEDQIEIMMLRDAQAKIVSALLKLARASCDPSGRSCWLDISPMDLSSRVGLDMDAVKRGVQQLRDGRYVRVVDERLEIPDLQALARLYSLLALKDEIRGSSATGTAGGA
ncbi:MAG: Crp/Fnr family transcriptional regulator [Polyangiaceae bacterium]|jgi:CRP-like cAMP-binding protein|nr:Crp/Fnr family transcriptional regulator [Polyangiaceae bacterium]